MITECGVIETPGAYALGGNLTSSGTCLEIRNSSVTIDGMGYTITGETSADRRHGIHVMHEQDVTIRNLSIQGFSTGDSGAISFRSIEGGTIENVHASGNYHGIMLDTGDGIDGSHNITVEDNTITGSIDDGIRVGEPGAPSNDNTIRNNSVTDNDGSGIRIIGGSSSNVVDGNTLIGNDGYPIEVSGGSANSISDNLVTNNVDSSSSFSTNTHGIWVGSDAHNVTVANNEVRENEGDGIHLHRAVSVMVIGNQIVDNDGVGIQVGGSSSAVTDSIVSENVVTENAGFGIRLEGNSNNNTIDDNTVTLNGFLSSNGMAISLSNVANNTITNNLVTGNPGGGISLQGGAADNELRNNTISGHPDYAYGFRIHDSVNTTLIDNVVNEDEAVAITITGTSSNTIVENLDIGHSTEANTTISFEAAHVSIAANATPPAHQTAVAIGRFFEVESHDESGAFLDIDLHWEEDDVVGADESTLAFWKYDGTEWSEIPESSVDTDAQIVSANLTTFSTFGVFGDKSGSPNASFSYEPTEPTPGEAVTFDATDSTAPTGDIEEYRWDFTGDGNFDETTTDPVVTYLFANDGEYEVILEVEDEAGEVASTSKTITVADPVLDQIVIDEPGVYVLDDSYSLDITDPFIAITADDVVLDGNGHSVENAGRSGTAIYAENVENVTVRNLTMTTWQYGINFENVDGGTIEDVTATDIGQAGFYASASSNLSIANNTAIDNRDGFVLRASSVNNTLEYNTAQENRRYGFIVRDSTNNTLANNTATYSEDYGFRIVGSASHNVLVGNTATGSGDDSETGFDVRGDENELRDNVATNNEREGFRISGIGNDLLNNTATDNSRDGIRVVGAIGSENTLVNNTIERSGTHGLRIWSSDDNVLVGNVIVDNPNGITVHDSQGNTVEGNLVEDSDQYGIYLWNAATDNSFDDNTVRSSGSWDVYVTGGSANNPMTNLTIGEGDTQTTLHLDAFEVALRGTTIALAPPDGMESIDAYFEASKLDMSATLDVEIQYSEADVADVDEDSLILSQMTNLDLGWSTVEGSSVDTTTNVVSVTLDGSDLVDVSIFGVFSDEPSPANIILYGGSVTSTTVEEGDLVTVTGNLFNAGEIDGNETISLTVDGEVVDEANVTVAAGTLDTVELQWVAALPPGEESTTVDIMLDSLFVETLTVENLYSDIQVIAASASADEVLQNEPFHVVGSIYQNGTTAGPQTINLTATNQETGQEFHLGDTEANLPPGFYHLGAINITGVLDEPGIYDLTLGDRDAGAIEIIPAVSDIQVIAASASELEVLEDEEFYVVGSIYQNGTIEGPQTINLTATNQDTGHEVNLGNQTVNLPTGFYHLGALNVTAQLDEAGTYDLTLGDRDVGEIEVIAAESDIQVIAASASELEVLEDEAFYVVGSIYQNGTIEGPQTIDLTATNQANDETVHLGSQEVNLPPGFYHLGALNITAQLDEAGTYDLTLGDRDVGVIEIIPAVSDVQVIAASTSEPEVLEDEAFYVVGSIYQNGTIEGPQTIDLMATNQETGQEFHLGNQTVNLPPGFYHLGALNITGVIDEPGSYDLTLGDRNAGEIEVIAAESDIQVIAASASELEVLEDEAFYVVGSIYQNGTIEGPQTINLTATPTDGGDPIDLGGQTANLPPGFYHLGALNVTAVIDEPGVYDLALGDRDVGQIEVAPAVSDIEVIAGTLSEMNVTANEEFYVVGSIYQNGTIEGPQTINLTATNQDTGHEIHLGSQEVNLPPGFYHLGAINITTAIDTAGAWDVTLGDREVGTVYVDESPSDIQVIAASVSDIEVLEGEELYVVGSIYQAGETGTETIELVATDQDGNSITIGNQTVSLTSGWYHLGAINISFALDEPGNYTLTLDGHEAGAITVKPAVSDIEVIAASASEIEVISGEEFFVTGSLYQNGTIDGPETIELTAFNEDSGETVNLGSQEVTLSPGFYHLGAINITGQLDGPGRYTLTLGDRDVGQVEVQAAVSDIQVIAASVSDIEVLEGETFYVVGSIYQNGTIEGTETIELVATPTDGGDPIYLGNQEVTLRPGFYHLGAINITGQLDEPGTYDLTLGDRVAGQVEVQAAVSDIEVIAASISELEVLEGEAFHVIGSIYQGGTIDGPETIELVATPTDGGDPIHLGSQTVNLPPGFYHLGAINITGQLDEPGTYELTLGDRDAGQIEVLERTSDIQVIAASASTLELAAGQEGYVTGSIYQAGTHEGPQTIDLVAINQSTGETVHLASQTMTLAPGWYHLGALNVSFQIDDPGTYALELGGQSAGEIEVRTPVVEPSIVAVNGQTEDIDPATEQAVVYASDDVTVEIEVESDLEIDEVTLLVQSQATTYTASAAATHLGETAWVAEIPFDIIPDDGLYTLSVIAVDVAGYAGYDNPPAVLIDREPPSLAASVENVTSDEATVVVESDEPLADPPIVTVDHPDSSSQSTQTVTMTEESPTRFTGTLEFDVSGEYSVSAIGTDRAGNEGTDNASVVINTAFTLGHGEIVIDESGTTIAFDVADDADQAIIGQELFLAFSESTVNANLDGGELGVGFLTAELDSFMDYLFDEGTIEGATISMALDETDLPTGATIDDVGLYYDDPTTNQWEPIDSGIEEVAGQSYLVADVTGFSTYGALVMDTTAPVLLDASPGDGSTLSEGTVETTVSFSYEDTLSGVDVGSVSLQIDGIDVTGSDATAVTSNETTHTLAVDAGDSYEAILTVADHAGNEATYTTTFSVAESTTSPPGPSPPQDPDPEPEDPTDPEPEPEDPTDPDPAPDDPTDPDPEPDDPVDDHPVETPTDPDDADRPSTPDDESDPTLETPEEPRSWFQWLGWGIVVTMLIGAGVLAWRWRLSSLVDSR